MQSACPSIQSVLHTAVLLIIQCMSFHCWLYIYRIIIYHILYIPSSSVFLHHFHSLLLHGKVLFSNVPNMPTTWEPLCREFHMRMFLFVPGELVLFPWPERGNRFDSPVVSGLDSVSATWRNVLSKLSKLLHSPKLQMKQFALSCLRNSTTTLLPSPTSVASGANHNSDLPRPLYDISSDLQ